LRRCTKERTSREGVFRGERIRKEKGDGMNFLNWIVIHPFWGVVILILLFILADEIQGNFFNTVEAFAKCKREKADAEPSSKVK
jgi:hypothetical protein